MRYRLTSATIQPDAATERTLRLTFALSLLIHFAALLLLPRVNPLKPGDEGQALADLLQVQLAAPSPTPPEQKSEPPRRTVATVTRRVLPSTPPMRTTSQTRTAPPPAPPSATPDIPSPPAPPPPSPVLPRSGQPSSGDLWSYIQARRRERGEPTSAIASNRPESNANLAANLPSAATGVATQDRRRGGGMFEIRRMNYDDAAFEFFGWNNEMGRKTPQLVEVRIGNNRDMRIAVVRKMIAIIREHSQGDFVWNSSHRENGVTLSARLADNAELETFLLNDLFDEVRQPP